MPGLRKSNFAAAAIVAAFGLAACAKSEQDPRTREPLVRIATVEPAAASER